jgi:hypothetical protein
LRNARETAIPDPSNIAWPDSWGRPRPSGRDRREADRVMAYWRGKLEELGVDATIAALDLGSMNTSDWSNRFLIAVDRQSRNPRSCCTAPISRNCSTCRRSPGWIGR